MDKSPLLFDLTGLSFLCKLVTPTPLRPCRLGNVTLGRHAVFLVVQDDRYWTSHPELLLHFFDSFPTCGSVVDLLSAVVGLGRRSVCTLGFHRCNFID